MCGDELQYTVVSEQCHDGGSSDEATAQSQSTVCAPSYEAWPVYSESEHHEGELRHQERDAGRVLRRLFSAPLSDESMLVKKNSWRGAFQATFLKAVSFTVPCVSLPSAV